MEIVYIIGFLAFGLLVGFLSGAMGIGGGVIMVPVFMFFFALHGDDQGTSHYFALGSSLFAAVLAASSGAFRHLKNKNVELKLGIYFGLFAVISSSLLSFVALNTPVKMLKILFLIVLFFIIVRLFVEDKKDENKVFGITQKNIWLIPLVGGIIGMLSAFTGIGGGILAVPVFYYMFNLNFKKAIGTSSFVIIFSALSAVIIYSISGNNNVIAHKYSVGFVDLLVAIPTGLGTIFSAPYGADFAQKSNTRILKIIFSCLIVFTIIKMLFDLFG